MSKRVLVLSSSPRKGGNSDLLCDQFVLGAREAGHHAEKIFLKDRKINCCTGCGTCFEGAKRCHQKDDMPEVLEKMIGADVCHRHEETHSRRQPPGAGFLDENLGAVAVEPTPDDLGEINAAASKIPLQGARLPDRALAMTGR